MPQDSRFLQLLLGYIVACKGSPLPGARQLLFASSPGSADSNSSPPEVEQYYFRATQGYAGNEFADFAIDYDTQYGSGGMKTVYAATLPDGTAGAVGVQDVATSSLRQSTFDNTAAVIGDEFVIQEALAHCPNVAQVYGHGVAWGARITSAAAPAANNWSYPYFDWQRDTYFNMMPASVGGDLDTTRPHEPSTVIAAFRQLSKGLACMHRAGVLHLDIKPSNFFVRDEARTDFELADFGMSANLRTGVGLPAGKTKAPYLWDGDKYIGSVSSRLVFTAGTRFFWPPEYYRRCFAPDSGDGRHSGYKADIWALGVAFANLIDQDFLLVLVPEEGCDKAEIDSIQDTVDGWVDGLLYPEVTELVKGMLRMDPRERLTAEEVEQQAAALPEVNATNY